jgi:hypothetical protein
VKVSWLCVCVWVHDSYKEEDEVGKGRRRRVFLFLVCSFKFFLLGES